MTTDGVQVILPNDVNAGSLARRAIVASYPALSAGTLEELLLLVTEVVTNAVKHGGGGIDGPIQLEVRRDNGLVHVDVVDPGAGFAPPATTWNGERSGGWGLFLVDRIAERWGVSPTPSGTCVWFEVPAARA